MSKVRPDNTSAWCGCKGADSSGCDLHGNPPGARALRYRVGTHGSFYASMLSRLPLEDVEVPGTGQKQRPLAALSTRDEGDPVLSVCDAWASVLDVLTFYQERIANEGFLRTGTERRSVLELARQIGYELAPGVAASTHLAFEVDGSEGAAGKARVPSGTRVSSIPGQDETPQTYETTEELADARADWNTLPVRTTRSHDLTPATRELLVQGTDANLEPGMALLVVDGKAFSMDRRAWTWTRVHSVHPDHEADTTRIVLEGTLGDHLVTPTGAWDLFGNRAAPRFYAMHRRASFFGHNAQDWASLSLTAKKEYLGVPKEEDLTVAELLEWRDFEIFARTGEPVPASGRSRQYPATVESVANVAIVAGRKAAENLRSSAMSSAQSAVQGALSATLGAIQGVGEALLQAGAQFMAGLPQPPSAFDTFLATAQQEVNDAIRGLLQVVRGLFPSLDTSDLTEGEEGEEGQLFVPFGDFQKIVDFLSGPLTLGALDESSGAPLEQVTGSADALKNILQGLEDAILSNPLLAPLKAFQGLNLSALVATFSSAKAKVEAAIKAGQQSAHTGAAAVTATGMGETLKAVVDRSRQLLENPLAGELYDAFVTADEDEDVLDPERMAYVVRVTVKGASLAAALNPSVVLSGSIEAAFEGLLGFVEALNAEDGSSATSVDANWMLEEFGNLVVSSVVEQLEELSEEGSGEPDMIEGLRFLLDELLVDPEASSPVLDLEAVLGFSIAVAGALGFAALPVSPAAGALIALVNAVTGGMGTVVATTAGPLFGMATAASLVAGPAIYEGIRTVKDGVLDAVYAELMPHDTPLPDARSRTGVNTGEVDLDAIYDRVTPGGAVLITAPVLDDAGQPLAGSFEIEGRTEVSRSDYNLTAKVSRLKLVGAAGDLKKFRRHVRDGSVFLQSQRLELADVPDDTRITGTHVEWAGPLAKLAPGRLLLAVAGVQGAEEEVVGEVVAVETATSTSVTLVEPGLRRSYPRDAISVYGNVVPATHGESREEVLGSGDASTAHQFFELGEMPLTYVPASTLSGRATTLELRVGDIRWEGRENLLDAAPGDRAYQVRHADGGEVTVQFGDGARGARLPSGLENVTCTYRVGTGLEGLVRAQQLRVLRTRPLGVRGVTNPLESTGAEDPESLADARIHAPTRVLTLDRIVSLHDYENFARTYAGIAKARAAFVPLQGRTVVHVTLAGVEGAKIEADAILVEKLRDAMGDHRDPSLELRLDGYKKLEFEIAANLAIHPDHDGETVLEAARARLFEAFGFAAREFTVPVNRAEVMALLHDVPGVVYVDLDRLGFVPPSAGEPLGTAALGARPAREDPDNEGSILPAEILVLKTVDLRGKE